MAKKKRPSRLAWFALDVDAFLEDERMQTLTNKEKSYWALMIIKSFRNQGIVITDPSVIVDQTGATLKEAKTLVSKLLQEQLLIPTGKVFKAVSNRLKLEFETAQASYARYSELGNKSAEKHGAANLRRVK